MLNASPVVLESKFPEAGHQIVHISRDKELGHRAVLAAVHAGAENQMVMAEGKF